MKTMKELKKEIKDLEANKTKAYEQNNNKIITLDKNIEKLRERQEKLYTKFEERVRSYFGIVDIKVFHNNQVCKVSARDKEFFKYSFEFIIWEDITEQTALEIKALYNELYECRKLKKTILSLRCIDNGTTSTYYW